MKSQLWKSLSVIVLANTHPGSKHQLVAMQMLEAMLRRGYEPQIIEIKCARCGKDIANCVRWTNHGTIVDSWGFIEHMGNERVCSDCLGEGYIGMIIDAKPGRN